jgi:hypothetical protein
MGYVTWLLIGMLFVIGFERQRVEDTYQRIGLVAASALFLSESLICALMVYFGAWAFLRELI